MKELTAALPVGIHNNLKMRAVTGSAAVYEERVLMGEERDIREVMERRGDGARTRPVVDRVRLGEFRGLRIFKDSIRMLLVERCETPLRAIAEMHFDNASEARLRSLANLTGEIPSRLDDCEDLLRAGEAFFTAHNHGLLCHLAKTRDEKTAIARVRRLFTSSRDTTR